MGIPDHLTCLMRNLYADQKAKLKQNMEQQTGSRLGKDYIKAAYCHPAYLTSMQSTSCKMIEYVNHNLESIFPGEISTISDMQTDDYYFNGKKQRGTFRKLRS